MFSFPGINELPYDNPPPLIDCGINTELWMTLHASHCRLDPPCTPSITQDSCYFRPLIFMLRHGYQAHLAPGCSPADVRAHSPAYTHLWNKDTKRCNSAFEKLFASTDLLPVESPSLIFPLLPVYRGNHLWRFKKLGTDYLPRLTSDITSSGGNDVFSEWRLRYLSLHAVSRVISRGDFLATRDITGFYNRLPAGQLLRSFQCFQDPRSYASAGPANNAKVDSGDARFLQQQSCMFGHRQLPAWASCASSELARILHQNCARVLAVLIDDFMFHGLAALGAAALQKQLVKVDATMRDLGVPPNDKGQAPATQAVFSGILLDTVKGVYDVDEEQREYVLQRLIDIVGQKQCATKILESVNGSLGWLCYVIYHGRCRRDILQRACDSGDATTQITKALRQQLRWWIDILERRAYHPSPIWFHDEVQRSILIQSDASGDSGFGFCAAGLHVTGCWRDDLADTIEHDMFVKLPVAIAVLLLSPILHGVIFGCALDNSGVVARINCGSCRSPLGRRLMTAIADALCTSLGHILADWNNRDQPLAVHADDLSKILSPAQWKDLDRPSGSPWIFDLFIRSKHKTVRTSIRIPRLAEVLPIHLRHRESNRRSPSKSQH